MKERLLQLLDIRSDETWLVTNLFWLQFFQGVGVAIFNTVAFALFLGHFNVLELPKVYIFSAALLLIAGYFYTKAEHSLPMKKLVPLVIAFAGLSIFAFRLKYSDVNQPWFLFLMFSWYYVVYLLINLEFWGLAALQFDIRQSKRLFGMIGAGDIPAKLIGYSAVPVLIPFFSDGNMLIIAGVCILCSLFFYYRLYRSGKLSTHIKHDHAPAHTPAHKKSFTGVTINWQDMAKSFFGNRMIASVALLSFIVMSCVTIVSFCFYSQIKHEAHSDAQLESFIAIFFASARVIAIIVRLILTGRLMHVLGTKGSLLISPLILFGFLLVIIFIPFFEMPPHFILYIFGLMAILTEVLKISLQDPVFLSLMQPLSSSLRLRGHAVVKGIMDPFSYAFCGFMLLGLVKVSGGSNFLFPISYMLLVLLVIWVVMIFVADREYVRTLVTALDKRYTVGQEIDLTDEKTKEVLLSKITNSERGEAIYILNLIEKKYTDEQEELVLKALDHPKPEVRLEAIKMAERKKITAALPAIEKIINERTDIDILPEAVKAKCMLQPDELENLDVFVEDKDHRLMKSAITGLMTSGGISAVVTAGQRLLQLIPSPNANERKMAAEIIGELGVQSFYKPLLELLKDKDEEVVKAAIVAAGKVKNEKLIVPLMQLFKERRNERLVINALYEAGDVSLKEIKNILLNNWLSRQQQSRLILLCGRIGTENAAKLLDELIWKLPVLRTEIFHALHLCEFKSLPHNRDQHIALMNQYIASGITILFMIRELHMRPTTKILTDALYLELNDIRDSLLLLFSFLYNKEKMIKAKNAFLLNKRESVANALEVIEIEVPKEISLKFNKIFEPGQVHDKCITLKVYYKDTPDYKDIIGSILNDKSFHFHRWTKAAALYSTIFYKGEEKRGWLEKLEKETDILLKETAHKILAESN